jgi:serine/threonine-protein kinase
MPSGEEARSDLQRAEASLAAGAFREALRFANRSLRKERSLAALAARTKAYCGQRNLGLAKSSARGLRGSSRRSAARFCKEHGIEL